MAFFVGGQLMLAAVVVPVLRGLDDRGRLVAVLIGAHLRRPEWHALDAAIFIVSVAIVWLGIAVAG
jgi:hypothetical protein